MGVLICVTPLLFMVRVECGGSCPERCVIVLRDAKPSGDHDVPADHVHFLSDVRAKSATVVFPATGVMRSSLLPGSL